MDTDFDKKVMQERIELWCDADRRRKLGDNAKKYAPTIGEAIELNDCFCYEKEDIHDGNYFAH